MTQQSHSWAYTWRKTTGNDTCSPVFTAALFTIAKTRKQPKCPLTEGWIEKMWSTHTHTHMNTYTRARAHTDAHTCIHTTHAHTHTHTHTHNGIYSATKKNEIMPFAAAQIALESLVLSEGSQTEKYDFPYMWTLKRNYTNELLQNRKRLTDLENEPMVAGEEGIVRDFGWTCTHGCI